MNQEKSKTESTISTRETTINIEDASEDVAKKKSRQLQAPHRKAIKKEVRHKLHKADPAGHEQPVHVPGMEMAQPAGREMHSPEENVELTPSEIEGDLEFERKMYACLFAIYAIPTGLLLWTQYSPTLQFYMASPFGLMCTIGGALLNFLIGYIQCSCGCSRDFITNYFLTWLSGVCVYGIAAGICPRLNGSFSVIFSSYFTIMCVAFINMILACFSKKSFVEIKLGRFMLVCIAMGVVFAGASVALGRYVLKVHKTGLEIGLSIACGIFFNFLPYLHLYFIWTDRSIKLGDAEGPYTGWILSASYYTLLLVLANIYSKV